MSPKPDKRIANMLSVGAVARKLGVTRQRVDALLNEDRIKYVWIGAHRYVKPEDAVLPKPKTHGRARPG